MSKQTNRELLAKLVAEYNQATGDNWEVYQAESDAYSALTPVLDCDPDQVLEQTVTVESICALRAQFGMSVV